MEKEILDDLLIQVERNACKDSFYEFFLSFWGVIIEEELSDNWHIRFLCNELQKLSQNIVARKKKLHDIIINIPPGTTKSTITTIMFPAWLWTQDPSIRVITNSYSADLSLEHSVKSRDIITSDKYQTLFPEIRLRGDKAAKGSYENTNKGARYSTSTGGTIMGKHAHIIINDDPVNSLQAVSSVKREAANEHTKTLSSRKVSKRNTPTVTIMQRLHIKDTTGYLLGRKRTGIHHICMPCKVSDNVKPSYLKKYYKNGLLDPVRLSEEIIQESKMELGSLQFAGQFEQTPTQAEGNIFKRAWFHKISWVEFERIRGLSPMHFFADTAFTEKKENDPSGIITACKIGNNVYIVHSTTVRKKFPDLIRYMISYVKQYYYTGESTVRIEPKANGLSVIHELQEKTGLNVTQTDTPKDSKEVRANAAAPTCECGRVILVDGDWNDDWLDEVCGFPRMEHDEKVDLLGYMIKYFLSTNSEWADQEVDKLKSVI